MQLLATQQVGFDLQGTDAVGNPTDIPGDLLVFSTDESILTVTDGGTDASPRYTAVTTGTTGTCGLTATDDVNSDGTPEFQSTEGVDVTAGPIQAIAFSFGEPTDRPL